MEKIMFVVAMFAVPVMLLWNYVCPDVFHLHQLNFWHAWALLMLVGLASDGVWRE